MKRRESMTNEYTGPTFTKLEVYFSIENAYE